MALSLLKNLYSLQTFILRSIIALATAPVQKIRVTEPTFQNRRQRFCSSATNFLKIHTFHKTQTSHHLQQTHPKNICISWAEEQELLLGWVFLKKITLPLFSAIWWWLVSTYSLSWETERGRSCSDFRTLSFRKWFPLLASVAGAWWHHLVWQPKPEWRPALEEVIALSQPPTEHDWVYLLH